MTHFSELWKIIKSSKSANQQDVIGTLINNQDVTSSKASSYCTGNGKNKNFSHNDTRKILWFYETNKLVSNIELVFEKGFTSEQIVKCINLLTEWSPNVGISERAYNFAIEKYNNGQCEENDYSAIVAAVIAVAVASTDKSTDNKATLSDAKKHTKSDQKTEFSKAADNTEILRRLCSCVPAVSFFGQHGSVSIDSMFVPPRFKNNAGLQDVVDSIYPSDSTQGKQGCIIIGKPGSGRTTALNTIVMNHICKKSGADCSWSGFEDKIPEDAIVFVMRVHEVAAVQENDFNRYIRASITANEPSTSDSEIFRTSSLHFSDAIKNYYNNKKPLLFIIDGLEEFVSDNNKSAEEKRYIFLNSLCNFCNDHPNVKFIISSTPSAVVSLENIPEFNLCAPSDADINAFCKRWIKLFPSDYNNLKNPAIELSKAIIKNAALRSTIDSPQMIMFFLTAAKTDGINTQYYSQLHMMRVIASTCLHTLISKHSIDRYDFLIPLSFLALKCCEMNLNGLPIYDANPSVESILTDSNNHKLMSAYLTDDSELLSYKIKKIDSFIKVAKDFPLIIVSDGENARLDFTTPTWCAFYASYALAQELIAEPLSQYIDKKMEELSCDYSIKVNDEYIKMWISVLARTAKLSRRRAEDIVAVLEKYASDFTPKKRKGREIAIYTLLKILRNRAFISDELRKDSIFVSLSYYFYFNQIDDFVSLITSSCYRKSIVNYMFNEFMGSITSTPAEPIPLFLWVIGYMMFKFTDLSAWNGDIKSAETKILLNIESKKDFSLTNANNAINRLDDFDKFSISSKILYTLACASFIWQTYGLQSKKNIGQLKFTNNIDSTLSFNINQYQAFFINILSNDDFRLSNIAGFALTHLTTAQIDGTYNDNIIENLSAVEKLKQILRSDYMARQAFDSYNNAPNQKHKNTQTFCGALRLLTTLSPKVEQYGLCCDIDYNINSYYKNIWNYYSEIVDEGKSSTVTDNAKRYLMLCFKLCFLVGAFDENVSSCVKPIEKLWNLKYPESPIADYLFESDNLPDSDIVLGLDYDNENEFFQYILSLYKKITE